MCSRRVRRDGATQQGPTATETGRDRRSRPRVFGQLTSRPLLRVLARAKGCETGSPEPCGRPRDPHVQKSSQCVLSRHPPFCRIIALLALSTRSRSPSSATDPRCASLQPSGLDTDRSQGGSSADRYAALRAPETPRRRRQLHRCSAAPKRRPPRTAAPRKTRPWPRRSPATT